MATSRPRSPSEERAPLATMVPMAIMATMVIHWRQWWSIGSPLSPLNRHCHQDCNMAILAVTSPFNGAIVAIKMARMVTNGDRQWRKWRSSLSPMDHHFFPFFVAIGANGEMSNSLWHFYRKFNSDWLQLFQSKRVLTSLFSGHISKTAVSTPLNFCIDLCFTNSKVCAKFHEGTNPRFWEIDD